MLREASSPDRNGRHAPPEAPARLLVLTTGDAPSGRVAALHAARHEVEERPLDRNALRRIRENPPDLVIALRRSRDPAAIELLRALRDDPGAAPLPVIILASEASEPARIEAFRAGADDYLEEPFSSDELLARVEARLRRSGPPRRSERDLRETSRRLERAEERMAFVRRTSGVGYWHCDLPFDVLHWDEHVKAHFHLPPDARVTVDTFYERLHPSDRERTRLAIERAIERRACYDIDFRTVDPHNRDIKWIRAIGRANYDHNGQPLHFDGVTIDITTRKRTVDEAAAAARRLALIADAMPALISYVDETGRYQFNNSAYEEWFGQKREDINGRHLRDVLGEDAWRVVEPHVRAALEGRRTSFEAEVPHRDGGTSPVAAEYVPDVREDGRVRGFYVLVTDVTRRREHERAHARLAAIVQSSGDAVISKTLDGVIETWNDGARRIFGYTAEEAIGRHITMLLPPERLEEESEIIAAVRAGRPIEHYETTRRRKDGSLVSVSLSVSPVRDAAGRIIGASKIARDITERQRFERRLRKSEARFRAMANAAPAMLWVSSPDGAATFLSRGWHEYTGQSEDEASGFGWLDAIHPDDRKPAERTFFEANAKREPVSLDYRLRRADGAYRWCIDAAKPSTDDEGRFLGYVGSVIDVHERKQAETALLESEQRLRGIFDQTIAGIAQTDTEGRFVLVNQRYCDIVGRTAEELYKLRMQDITHPDDLARNLPLFKKAVHDGDAFRIEKRCLRPDGASVWVSNSVSALRDADQTRGIVAVAVDVTKRHQAEEAVRRSEERFRSLFESMDQGYCVVEVEPAAGDRPSDFRIIEMNPAFEKHTGQRDLLGRSIRESLPDLEEFWFDTYARVARTGDATRFVHQAAPMDERWFDVYAFRLGGAGSNKVAILFSDISERKAQEARMRTVMAELNHRVKNTLAVVSAIATQTSKRSPDLESFTRSFGERLRSIAKAHSLLTSTDWEGCSLAEIVRSEIDPRVSTARQADIQGPHILLTPKQCLVIHMVVHELATNAMKYGALRDETGRVDVRWELERQAGDRWLRIEWRERCRRPVPSPREEGYGSRLIEQSVGYELQGELERTFTEGGLACSIRVPLNPPRQNERPLASPDHPSETGPRRVLVVEDNAMIAMALAEELDELGIDVLGPASSLDEAVRLAEAETISLALLDVDLSGDKVYPLARSLEKRGVPFVFLTGFDAADLPDDLRGHTLVSKPIRREQLRKIVAPARD